MSANPFRSPAFHKTASFEQPDVTFHLTCAAPADLGTFASNSGRKVVDVWVCGGSYGFGQVLVVTPLPTPRVTLRDTCNAAFVSIASIPSSVDSPQAFPPPQPAEKPVKTSDHSPLPSPVDMEIEIAEPVAAGPSASQDDAVPGPSTRSDDAVAGPSTSSPGYSAAGPSSGPQSYANAGARVVGPPRMSVEDGLQGPTMWVGTQDGYIRIYSSWDVEGPTLRPITVVPVPALRTVSVHCIVYSVNKVYVSLSDGKFLIYMRQGGIWNTSNPPTFRVSEVSDLVSKVVPLTGTGHLWCTFKNTIRIFNMTTNELANTITADVDRHALVNGMVALDLSVWVAFNLSPVLKLFNAATCVHVCDVDITPVVMNLPGIHKESKSKKSDEEKFPLHVTRLLVCQDLLWIGTSEGVVLTMPIPYLNAGTVALANPPVPTALHNGHTKEVEFLTAFEAPNMLTPPPTYYEAPNIPMPPTYSEVTGLASSLPPPSTAPRRETVRTHSLASTASNSFDSLAPYPGSSRSQTSSSTGSIGSLASSGPTPPSSSSDSCYPTTTTSSVLSCASSLLDTDPASAPMTPDLNFLSRSTSTASPDPEMRVFVMSGGYGYKVFRDMGGLDNAWREDTGHFLLWKL